MKAAFPGSFDPPTLGHIDIIRRAASLFDEVLLVVAENRAKTYLFSARERLELLADAVKPWKNVQAALCAGLTASFLKERNIAVLIRGIRDARDFSGEFEGSLINKALNPGLETLFMAADPAFFALRSSSVKELASFGGDVSTMVPGAAARALAVKFGQEDIPPDVSDSQQDCRTSPF